VCVCVCVCVCVHVAAACLCHPHTQSLSLERPPSAPLPALLLPVRPAGELSVAVVSLLQLVSGGKEGVDESAIGEVMVAAEGAGEGGESKVPPPSRCRAHLVSAEVGLCARVSVCVSHYDPPLPLPASDARGHDGEVRGVGDEARDNEQHRVVEARRSLCIRRRQARVPRGASRRHVLLCALTLSTDFA
jgi:hypothetical protein